jgi:chemotaxis protein MotB
MAFKPKPEEKKAGAPEWMNTYGDMVTLLLCFFVLLFSMSSLDVAKFQELAQSYTGQAVLIAGGMGDIMSDVGMGLLPDSAATEEVQSETPTEDEEEDFTGTAEEIIAGQEAMERERQLNEFASDFKTYFAQDDATSGIQVDVNDPYVEFTFPGSLLFDSGLAELKPEAMLALDSFAERMLLYPDYNIRIEGHTDNVPMSGSNRQRYPTNWHLSSARAASVIAYLVDEKQFDPGILSVGGMSEYTPVGTNDTEEGRQQNRRVVIKVFKLDPLGNIMN